jgi:hypothetical protein
VGCRPGCLANDRSPVGSHASCSVDPVGASRSVGQRSEEERTSCEHGGECSVLHLSNLSMILVDRPPARDTTIG